MDCPFPLPSRRREKKGRRKIQRGGYENGEMVGVKKLLGPLAPYERIGPIRVVGFRTRGTINPGGFAMEFLRSWSELGVALRLELRFDLSPTASHATAITHRPLISIFRPARAPCPTIPSHPVSHLPRLHHRHSCSFFCFFIAIVGTRIHGVLTLFDVATYKRPRSNRPTWINRTADSLPSLSPPFSVSFPPRQRSDSNATMSGPCGNDID